MKYLSSNKIIPSFTLLFAMWFFSLPLLGQNYSIKNAEFEVVGTSTLHDWTMTSKTAKANVKLTKENNKISSIEQFDLKLRAESLKSGKDKMDEISYESMKTKEHPWITFKLVSVKNIQHNGSNTTINAIGDLTIAGKTNRVSITGIATNGSYIQLSGSKKIKMTDFNIDPPTAMFGTIKTGDDLTINYTINLNQQSK